MPDQTVIRTETIAGRTYALVDVGFSPSCHECSMFRRHCQVGRICTLPGDWDCVVSYYPVAFGQYVELPRVTDDENWHEDEARMR